MTERAEHPAAALFPMMDAERFASLVESIRNDGLLHPIVLHSGAILDGRNRFKACEEAGVVPRFMDYIGDPVAYTWTANAERRDLSAGQRAAIFLNAIRQSGELQRRVDEIAAEANRKRSEAAKAQPRTEDGTRLASSGDPTTSGATSHSKAGAEALAEASGTNRGAIEQAIQLDAKRPDLAEKVRAGKLKPTAATRKMKRDALIEALEGVAAVEVKAAAGVYDVLVVDPPWPMERIERDLFPNQVGFDYPTMSEEEIADLGDPLRAMMADDCHAFIWTTQRFLPVALRLLDGWGLRYVLTMVWHKPGGFQPVGLPQYNCEFAVYARKGSPAFIDTKAFPVCFEAPRREHSRKPDYFYDLIQRVTAGRRIDVFSREARDGFDQYGNELGKFGRAG
jgi:N6-adenosine-specific RNA methylase IME4